MSQHAEPGEASSESWPCPLRVVTLVLAAGRARRFGSDKRQACLPDGRSMLEAVLQTQREACDDVRVLLRPDDAWGQALCADLGVAWLAVADADQGMGRTLAVGLRALVADEGEGAMEIASDIAGECASECAWVREAAKPSAAAPGGWPGAGSLSVRLPVRIDAALVVLADMPAVQPDTVRALIDAFQREGRPAWPWHGGRPGHPRLLPRANWSALFELSGDEGARHSLDWSQATRVDVTDRGILIDIDTPGDLGG